MSKEEILYFPAIPSFSIAVSHGMISTLSTKEEAALFFASGDTILIVGMRVYELLEGDALLLPPFTLAIPKDKSTPIVGYRLSLPYDILSLFAPKLIFHAANMGCVLSLRQDAQVMLLDNMRSIAEKSASPLSTLPSLFTLLEKETLCVEKKEMPIPILLRRAMKYINDHVDEEFSLTLLSERYRISESTLHRVFRKHLSMTPLAYRKHLCQVLLSKQE